MEWHDYLDEDHSACEYCKWLKATRPFISQIWIGPRDEPFAKRCSELSETEVKIIEWCISPFGYKEWSDELELEHQEAAEEAWAESCRMDHDWDYY
jgi:hypothetical protein